MSKGKHRRQQPIPQAPRPAPPPSAAAGTGTIQVQLGYDPKGKSEPVDIVSSKDGWSEYTLADGTVVRTKAAVLDVKIAIGQYNPEGDPIYIVQAAVINQAIV